MSAVTSEFPSLYTVSDLARATGYSVARIRILHKQRVIDPHYVTARGAKLFSTDTVKKLIERRSRYLTSITEMVATSPCFPPATGVDVPADT